HVHGRARGEHGATRRHPDDADGVGQALGGQCGAVDRVDCDVPLRPGAIADPLTVVEHGGLVLLALTDHHDAVHPDCAEHWAHGVNGGRIHLVLVTEAHVPGAVDRGGFGRPDQLECEISVRIWRYAFPGLGLSHCCHLHSSCCHCHTTSFVPRH